MWFKDEAHFKGVNGYLIENVWYPRVTKILEIKSKPALERFFREVESYSSADSIKQKSAEEGSLLHETLEKLMLGEKVAIPEEIRPALYEFMNFNQERKIVFPAEFVEKRIWSPRYKYAGTVDALAYIDGKFGVLDIKTSSGIYPEYNLQTAAYVSALQEPEVKQSLALPRDIETRWILRVDQHRVCQKCGATLREKGGRAKVRNNRFNGETSCAEKEHQWGETEGVIELKEFPYFYKDMKAFVAAKALWEWENDFWLRKVGYLEE